MNNKTTFSIILPLYNKEAHIKKTITSILKQSFTNYELLVIDDGSTDNSYEIVKSINDPRINIIQQPNSGPSKARNNGINNAKGIYIAFIDADDTWHPEYLESQYRIFTEFNSLMWSCVGYQRVYEKKIISTICFDHSGLLDEAFTIFEYFWTGAISIKREVFKNKRFLFNEDVSRSEDLELWYKLACIYPQVGYTNKILAYYYVSLEGSLTSTSYNNEDFSYLSLRNRIEIETKKINVNRKRYADLLLKNFIRKEILNTWRYTNLFKKYHSEFKPHLNPKLYNSLILLDFLPSTFKIFYIRAINTLKLFNN